MRGAGGTRLNVALVAGKGAIGRVHGTHGCASHGGNHAENARVRGVGGTVGPRAGNLVIAVANAPVDSVRRFSTEPIIDSAAVVNVVFLSDTGIGAGFGVAPLIALAGNLLAEAQLADDAIGVHDGIADCEEATGLGVVDVAVTGDGVSGLRGTGVNRC